MRHRGGGRVVPGVRQPAPDLPYAGFWARPDGAAALLGTDGVLIAGCEVGRRLPADRRTPLTPSTGVRTSTPPLRQALRLRTPTRLEEGRILAVGGLGADAADRRVVRTRQSALDTGARP
ncbi:hypothetical protein [Streptomyces sp. NPDC051921]|uniref:hypothetical protein n=1 Tax=Streptomyces sp. NPDC051921 TaxID=3155806 RepID=UPI00341D5006